MLCFFLAVLASPFKSKLRLEAERKGFPSLALQVREILHRDPLRESQVVEPIPPTTLRLS